MDIQERIKKIGTYFRGMNVAPGDDGSFITYVDVAFPPKWVIMESCVSAFNVEFAPNEGGYYFWTTSDNTNNVFDAIENNITLNIEAEAKILLLKQKVEELKSLFADENNSLEKLQSLTFSFDNSIKLPEPKPKAAGKGKAKKQEDVIKEEEIISEEEISKGL